MLVAVMLEQLTRSGQRKVLTLKRFFFACYVPNMFVIFGKEASYIRVNFVFLTVLRPCRGALLYELDACMSVSSGLA